MRKRQFLFFLLTYTTALLAQNKKDTLAKYSFSDLEGKINNYYGSNNLAKLEATSLYFLEKAKKEKNNEQIAEGYIIFTSIPNETIELIIKELEKFENNKLFLKKELSLNSLAKSMNTNSTYLSEVINTYKNKNFSTYLNELRIKYIVKELKMNPKLQKLTIAGIAEEAGFNNSESFTNSFKKITGTLPSYYIKALKT